MTNWPLAWPVRSELLGAGTGTGVAVTAGTVNTKGAAATIGTTGFRYSGFFLHLANTGGAAKRYRLDILVNTGASDQVLVADLSVNSVNIGAGIYLPIAVPSGAVLKAKLQSTTAADAATVAVLGIACDFPGETGNSRAISCTDFTNTDPTNTVTQTGTTPTAYTQICASTSAQISRLYLTPTGVGDNSRTLSDFIVDIAVGAAGSEQIIGRFFGRQIAANALPVVWEMLCNIPAGTRLSFRVTCSAAAADSFGVVAWGLAA